MINGTYTGNMVIIIQMSHELFSVIYICNLTVAKIRCRLCLSTPSDIRCLLILLIIIFSIVIVLTTTIQNSISRDVYISVYFAQKYGTARCLCLALAGSPHWRAERLWCLVWPNSCVGCSKRLQTVHWHIILQFNSRPFLAFCQLCFFWFNKLRK